MLTVTECKAHATECQLLMTVPEISIQRATVLMAMSRSWVALTVLTERYTAIVDEEEGRPTN
jgi:hypothetical protein